MTTRMIYQVYVGKPSVLYDTCVQSVTVYCAKHGIDHVIQREPILKICPDMNRTERSQEAVSRLGYLPIFEKENRVASTFLNTMETTVLKNYITYSPFQSAKLKGYEFTFTTEQQGVEVGFKDAREKQIKGGSRFKKIELINSFNPDCEDLSNDWFTNEDIASFKG